MADDYDLNEKPTRTPHTDEDLIELTDRVFDGSVDDEIIDLTDRATDGIMAGGPGEIGGPAQRGRGGKSLFEPTETVVDATVDEEILELTEQVPDPAPDTSGDTYICVSDALPAGTNRAAVRGMMATDVPVPGHPGQGQAETPHGHMELPVTVTPEQVEAALEKIIEKYYAQTIETLLKDTVQSVLEREIAALRSQIITELNEQGRC